MFNYCMLINCSLFFFQSGTSVGESSSGANRKLTTNHRHSCGNPGCGNNFVNQTFSLNAFQKSHNNAFFAKENEKHLKIVARKFIKFHLNFQILHST